MTRDGEPDPMRDSSSPVDGGPREAERPRGESWRRVFETSLEGVLRDGARLKQLLTEMKLPRELVNQLLSQIEDTKQSALKVVGRETRQFLERVNVSEELAKLLTRVSLRVDVRFVPNESAIDAKWKEPESTGRDRDRAEEEASREKTSD
ncbi:MAG: hypothetical protein R6V85_10545 [Polyangia bacterium]